MTALVFTSLAAAQAIQSQVDAALGMPLATATTLDPTWANATPVLSTAAVSAQPV